MRATICLGQIHCTRLGPPPGTSTCLRWPAKNPQQRLFSTCPRRLLPEAALSAATSSVGGHSVVVDRDYLAHLDGRRREPSSPEKSSQQESWHEEAPPSACANTRRSSRRGDGRVPSSGVSRFSKEEAPPQKRSRPRAEHGHNRPRRRQGRPERNMRMQWGYLRRRYAGEELVAVKKAFNAWKKNFTKITGPPNPDRPWEKDAEWLLKHDSVPAMRAAWRELDETTQRRKWPLIMLSAMCIRPQRVHTVLEATLHPHPPGYAINDILLFVARNTRLGEASTSRQRALEAEAMMDFLRNVVAETPKGHIPFTQRVFGRLAKALPGEQAHELYLLLREHAFDLHANTLIQFASKLAASATHKQAAFEILQALSDAGADLNEARPSSVITSLLHCKAPEERGVDAEPSFDAKAALRYFIERGFVLNVIASTAFLDTLCQWGEGEEAIRLASLFAEAGIRLDKKAWATVFRGAKGTLRMDNIAKALELAERANVPIVDVLNNALHSAFMLSETERREKKHEASSSSSSSSSSSPALFVPLLRIYAKRFDLEPLQWWLPDMLPLLLTQSAALGQQREQQRREQDQQGLVHDQPSTSSKTRTPCDFESTIIPFTDRFFSASGQDAKLQPSPATIAIMLRAYVRSLRQPYDLVTYYAFFRERLEEQSRDASLPPGARLVTSQGTLIHDTFILAMSDHPDLSRPALEIFGDMLRDHQVRAAVAAPPEKQVDGNNNNNNNSGSRSRSRSSSSSSSSNRNDSNRNAGNDGNNHGNPPTHPPPGVTTFTILLRGRMNPHHRHLADQLLHMMREHDLDPNLVTWNTLISGYAHMQNIAKTVDALQAMEATGRKPDMYTFKAFARLRDQGAALRIMESMIDVNRRRVGEGV